MQLRYAPAMHKDSCAPADLVVGAACRRPAPAAAPKARQLPKRIVHLCSSAGSVVTRDMSSVFILMSLFNAPEKPFNQGFYSTWAQASTVGQ